MGSRPHSDYLWIQTQVEPIPKPSPSPQHHSVPTPIDLVTLCLKTLRQKRASPCKGVISQRTQATTLLRQPSKGITDILKEESRGRGGWVATGQLPAARTPPIAG